MSTEKREGEVRGHPLKVEKIELKGKGLKAWRLGSKEAQG